MGVETGGTVPEYEVREPEFDDTTTEEWNRPQQNDFDTDDLEEIARHFVLSEGGFPPENFGDLDVPVVDPDGNLNLSALRTAKSGGRGVRAVGGIDQDTAEEALKIVTRLANENFEEADFDEPEDVDV